jgi:S1-C subfamily serine protease
VLLGAALLLSASASAAPAGSQFDREAERLEARIMRVLPGVVGIITEVGAEVTVRCNKDDSYVVKPVPSRENGTGFIIHPDGYVATNGHVVKPVYKDDAEYQAKFLRSAVEAACAPGLAKQSEAERKRRLQAIAKDPLNRNAVKLLKKLLVFLPTKLPPDQSMRAGLPAEVLMYSGPIEPEALPAPGVKPSPPMLDVAIIKVMGKDLPTARLSSSIRRVHLGQPVVIVGYPGVVLWHDFLSKTSRAEPTVTFGRVSSFKTDVNERRIIQTDAAISWGNSGGPGFNAAGEVVGAATFISTSLEGDQAIQGFNFLIPVDTVHDAARQIGLKPSSESAFTRAWDQAVNEYFEGRFREALTHVEAADAAVPNLMEVDRLRGVLTDLIKGERP